MSQNNSNDVSNESKVNFDNFINKNRLNNEYEINPGPTLGYGTYGVVIKAQNKIDDKQYAIKMIAIRAYTKPQFKEDKTMVEDFYKKIKEVKIWARLQEVDYCVQYRSAWLEKDPESKKGFLKFFCDSLPSDKKDEFLSIYTPLDLAVLHIQMDLCSMSLSSAMTQMEEHFGYKTNQGISSIPYYISSEILYEILEAVNHLHEQMPPIIHRDVKPANILIKFTSNGRCVKLGDFGLAVLHEAQSQSHTKGMGTEKYMAPEVRSTRKYTTKADVYSIGVIIQKLFNFDINRPEPKNLDEKYRYIMDMTADILSGVSKVRPECKAVMKQRKEWALNYSDVRQEIENMVNINTKYEIQDQFVLKFLQTKYKQNNK